MESVWPSMPSFKKDTLWPDFLKTHLRGDSPMDTTLSSKVPGTVVPYVIYLASKNCIILRAGLFHMCFCAHARADCGRCASVQFAPSAQFGCILYTCCIYCIYI